MWMYVYMCTLSSSILNQFLPALFSDNDLATSIRMVPYNSFLYADYNKSDLLNINIGLDVYSW